MKKNPFKKNPITISSRKNPQGEYANLSTKELLDAVKQSAHSIHRADLDILLDIFLKRYDARQNELDTLNKDLEKRISDEVNLGKANQKRFEQQAKMAAMGEMMDAVAHQWKQPLNALSMMSDILKSDFEDDAVDKAYIDELTNDTQVQIEHMVNTLSEFRNFFRSKQTLKKFSITHSLESVMLLVKDEFLKNNITINVLHDDELYLTGNENEFKHLILNIINNAKDAFNEREILSRIIDIHFYKKDDFLYMNLQDTAGGIPQNIIKDIFKPEVTTKEVGKGTGIGLYMSTQIVYKLGGTLSVKNIKDGACFSLKIPL